MLKAPKKYSKKELKHDPLLDTMVKTQTFYEENKKRIHGISGGFIAIILIIFLLSYLHQSNEEKAAILFGKAQVEYQDGNYAKARQFLEYLVDAYNGTTSGDQGLFLLANINFNQNKFDDARQLYQRFVDSYSGSEILLASGYAGLAACHEAQGDYIQAAENYLQAWQTAGDFPEAENYLFMAAVNFEFAGNKEKAHTYYQKLVDTYPKSRHLFEARAKLTLLAAK